MLHEFHTGKGFERRCAANRPGWSYPILREVEESLHDVTLFELQDMAAFLRMGIGLMIDGS